MFKNFFRIIFAQAAIVLLLSGCTHSNQKMDDPTQRLTEYISKSFSAQAASDKTDLLGFLTGEAKARLSAWSDEQFRTAFIDSKRKFIKLLIRENKKLSPSEVNITYELSYLDSSKGHDAKVTNKKLCTLVQEDGKWLIKDVHNIKELVEYQNEMSLP